MPNLFGGNLFQPNLFGPNLFGGQGTGPTPPPPVVSNRFLHSPAHIIQQLLINKGEGSDPLNNPTGPWLTRYSSEVSAPDEVMTVYDTEPQEDGQDMWRGRTQQHFGIMVRIRGEDESSAFAKAASVRTCFAEECYQDKVTLLNPTGTGLTTYLVWAVVKPKINGPLGGNVPPTRRNVFTLNALTAITLVS